MHRDEVWKLSGSRFDKMCTNRRQRRATTFPPLTRTCGHAVPDGDSPPSDRDGAIESSPVVVPVRAELGRTGLVSDQSERLERWLERERVVVVLENHHRRSTDLADQLVVVVLHIDVLVERRVELEVPRL